MHRTLIALVIGSAMAVTTPGAARAELRDRTGTAAAAGVAVLALVAAAIARKRQDRRDAVPRDQDFRERKHRSQTSTERLSLVRPGARARDADARVNLPGACRIRDDRREGYSGRCLQRYQYDQAALPSACAVQVGGSGLTIYRDRCLNGYGYY
jgi:hypothetical protein